MQGLRSLLSTQPNSAAKIAFAWSIAAGPALARASRLEWTDKGTLTVHASSEHWRRELQRARPVLAERLDQLLGAGVVARIVIQV
jgi:hypothetical protein